MVLFLKTIFCFILLVPIMSLDCINDPLTYIMNSDNYSNNKVVKSFNEIKNMEKNKFGYNKNNKMNFRASPICFFSSLPCFDMTRGYYIIKEVQ
uniref:Plasmodium yoelii subtelomeric region (PYST-C1) n=1 Tax=Strongyloides stercoralis TaxID=6248 RepID=A0A0K0E1X8_STRER